MFLNKEEFKNEFRMRLIEKYGRSIEKAHKYEYYDVLGTMIRDYASVYWKETKDKTYGGRQLIYFSMEFLLGRMMTSNLENLGIASMVKEGLEDLGISLDELKNLESDAGLGNGGLGRLAACFMDSLASDAYPGHGHTIRYEYGFFKQVIKDGKQYEIPDQWLTLGNVWEIRKPKHAVDVHFWGHVETFIKDGRLMFRTVNSEVVRAVPYDMPMIGYKNGVVNTLRLWSAEPSINYVKENMDFYEYLHNIRKLCHGLYPDDSTENGKYLRLKQQYFFVSAGLQSAIRQHLRNNPTLNNFHEKYVIQLNDTHPILAIPELMRILMDEYYFEWDEAWNIVTKTFAYTNHTVMAEALEKWPIYMIKTLLPRLYLIIEEINNRFVAFLRQNGHDEAKIYRLGCIKDGLVHMANLGVIASFKVNGVAWLHTEILKHNVMKDFYDIYPEKFNSKTNGISHRRFLAYSNPELVELINKVCGEDWIENPNKLEQLANNITPRVIEDFAEIKKARKQIVADYIKKVQGVEVDVNSIFDIQVKRLHAYKRQTLNIFHIIDLYLEAKSNPNFTMTPRTFIFGAKAAPSYKFAKEIIELIHAIANKVNNDPEVNKFFKVIFIENYDVSKAEIIMPSCDVSEQISMAGKEASGTGNMKFMMNGAITLGTYDGANVEISQLVGMDNCVIFGARDEELVKIQKEGSYKAMDLYKNNPRLNRILNTLIDGTWKEGSYFYNIFNEIMTKNDEFFILYDFESYREAQLKIQELYSDKTKWNTMCLMNVAKSGYFSSDRTIEEYVRDIWNLKKIVTK